MSVWLYMTILAPKPVGRRARKPGIDRKPRQAYSAKQLDRLESEFKVCVMIFSVANLSAKCLKNNDNKVRATTYELRLESDWFWGKSNQFHIDGVISKLNLKVDGYQYETRHQVPFERISCKSSCTLKCKIIKKVNALH